MLSLTLAIVPPLLILWYFWRQDQRRPEPKGLIGKVFLMGMLSVAPILVVELALQALFGPLPFWPKLLAESFIVAALTEEYFKRWVVTRYAYDHDAFDEIHDGVLYTIVASLGFACLENIMYASGDSAVGVLRAFTAVPLHALASGLMGYYIGRAKFAAAHERKGLMARGLGAAVGVHGLYDFFVLSGTMLAFLALPLLVGGFFHLKGRLALVQRLDAAAHAEAA